MAIVKSLLLHAAIIAMAVQGAYANGCYANGPTFSDVTTSTTLIENACKNKFSGSYVSGQTKSGCATYGSNRIDMSVTRFSSLPGTTLSVAEYAVLPRNSKNLLTRFAMTSCTSAFTIEKNGCPHGSEQDHNGFHYYIDPNNGAC